MYSGFSAQNIQLAIPEAVATSSNGFLTLSDRPIIATLVNAVKEMYNTVADFANEFRTKKLCVGDTCITEDQLKAMLQNQNIIPAQSTNENLIEENNTEIFASSTEIEIYSTSSESEINFSSTENIILDVGEIEKKNDDTTPLSASSTVPELSEVIEEINN
jgi:hypothetical protein